MSSAKVSKRPMTAGRAKKIAKNSLVHIILAILVVIWLFPIFWIIMTSLRGESGNIRIKYNARAAVVLHFLLCRF